MKNHIRTIRDPEIREIFTRLRIDLNILSSSKSQSKYFSSTDLNCPLCNAEKESVCHFLFRCVKLERIRDMSLNKIILADHDFKTMSESGKIQYILDLKCPIKNIGNICKFVKAMYAERELQKK